VGTKKGEMVTPCPLQPGKHLATRKYHLNCLLTSKSTFPIANVALEQGPGDIDVSLEVVNVVQDVQQNLLLKKGKAQEPGLRSARGCRGTQDPTTSVGRAVPVLWLSPRLGPVRQGLQLRKLRLTVQTGRWESESRFSRSCIPA
jgi:hypothetical protein